MTSIVAKPIGFKAYTRIVTQASAIAKDDADRRRIILRERLKAQCGLTDETLATLPIPEALRLKDEIDNVLSTPGTNSPVATLLSPPSADGISSAIHIQLSKPIPISPLFHISELEFLAATFGELEDAIAADAGTDRAIAMLSIATPIVMPIPSAKPDPTNPTNPPSLMRLTSAHIEQISVDDGIFIMQNVVPRFFEQPILTPPS